MRIDGIWRTMPLLIEYTTEICDTQGSTDFYNRVLRRLLDRKTNRLIYLNYIRGPADGGSFREDLHISRAGSHTSGHGAEWERERARRFPKKQGIHGTVP